MVLSLVKQLLLLALVGTTQAYHVCDVYTDPHFRDFSGTYHTPPHTIGWMNLMRWESGGVEIRVSTYNDKNPNKWASATVMMGVLIEVKNSNDHWEDLYQAMYSSDTQTCSEPLKTHYVEVTPGNNANPVESDITGSRTYVSPDLWGNVIKVLGTDILIFTKCEWWGYQAAIRLTTKLNAKDGLCVNAAHSQIINPDHLAKCPAVQTCCTEMGFAPGHGEWENCVEDTFDDCCAGEGENADGVDPTQCCQWPYMHYCGDNKDPAVADDFQCPIPGETCDENNGQCYADRYVWDEEVFKTNPKCSSSSCGVLQWDDEVFGTADVGVYSVCGTTFANDCPGDQTYEQAKAYCEDKNTRLCTRAEILEGDGYGLFPNPCQHDFKYVWTQSVCDITGNRFYAVNYKKGAGDPEIEVDCMTKTLSNVAQGGRCCADNTDLPVDDRVCRSEECGALSQPQSAIYMYETANLELERFEIGDRTCGDGYHSTQETGGWTPVPCTEVGEPWTAFGCQLNVCADPTAPNTVGYKISYTGVKPIPHNQVESEVSINCADGYGSEDGAKAISCFNQNGHPYETDGCDPIFCSDPDSIAGYRLKANRNLRWLDLNADASNLWADLGATQCADGYFGTPSFGLCDPNTPNGQYSLNGCFAKECIEPPTTVTAAYNIDNLNSNLFVPTFDVSVVCNIPNFYQSGDPPEATECTVDQGAYNLVGCSPSECNIPLDTTAYEILPNSVFTKGDTFNVHVQCADGYGPGASVVECASHQTDFELAGCSKVTCDGPSQAQQTGYILVGNPDFDWIDFNVLKGNQCALGYYGTPSVQKCDANHGGAIVLSGCSEGHCTVPTIAELVGFNIDEDEARYEWESFHIEASCDDFYYSPNGIDWERCDDHGMAYHITGCEPELCVAPAPANQIGYEIEQISLQRVDFDVNVECSNGYDGTAQVVPCIGHDLAYQISGCHEGFCTNPASTAGYRMKNAQSLSRATFDVLESVICADNYEGAATSVVCATSDTPYELQGCTAGFCTAPDITGYSVDELSLVFNDLTVVANCADFYHLPSGLTQVEVTPCTTINTPYGLDGCAQSMCVSPDMEGYVVSNENLWRGDFDVTVECDTGNDYVVGTAAATVCSGPGQEYTLTGCEKASIWNVDEANKYMMIFPGPGTLPCEGDTVCLGEFCVEDGCTPSTEPLVRFKEFTVPLTTYSVGPADQQKWGWTSHNHRYQSFHVWVEPNYKVTIEVPDNTDFESTINTFNELSDGENTEIIASATGDSQVVLAGKTDGVQAEDFTVVIRTTEAAGTTNVDIMFRVYFGPTQHTNQQNGETQMEQDGTCWGKVKYWAHDFRTPEGVSWYEKHNEGAENACQWYGEPDSNYDFDYEQCCLAGEDSWTTTIANKCNALFNADLMDCDASADYDYERAGMCFADAVLLDDRVFVDTAAGETTAWKQLEDDGVQGHEKIYAWQVCPNCHVCKRAGIGGPTLPPPATDDYDYEYTRRSLEWVDAVPGRRLLSAEQSIEADLLMSELVEHTPQLDGMTVTFYQEPNVATGRRMLFDDAEVEEVLKASMNKAPAYNNVLRRRRRLSSDETPLFFLTGDGLSGGDLAEKHTALAELDSTFVVQQIIQTTVISNQQFITEPQSSYAAPEDLAGTKFEATPEIIVSFVLGEPGVNCIQTCAAAEMLCDEFGFPQDENWAAHMDLVKKIGRDYSAKGKWNKNKHASKTTPSGKSWQMSDQNDIFYGTCKGKNWKTEVEEWGTKYAPLLFSIQDGVNYEKDGYCLPVYKGPPSDKRCGLQHPEYSRFCPCSGGVVTM